MAEEYMYLLTSLAVPKAKTLQEIQQATTKDMYNTVMLNALTVTRTQKWYNLDKLPEQFKMLISQSSDYLNKSKMI